jgi:hypothetical protein
MQDGRLPQRAFCHAEGNTRRHGPPLAVVPRAVDKMRKQGLLKEAIERFGEPEVAAALRVPMPLLQAWLRGHATMPDRKLLLLADLLDSSVP